MLIPLRGHGGVMAILDGQFARLPVRGRVIVRADQRVALSHNLALSVEQMQKEGVVGWQSKRSNPKLSWVALERPVLRDRPFGFYTPAPRDVFS